MDAVSSPSSFMMAFSSIAFIKQDYSFDSVSESHQLLLCNDCEGWPHRGGGGGVGNPSAMMFRLRPRR